MDDRGKENRKGMANSINEDAAYAGDGHNEPAIKKLLLQGTTAPFGTCFGLLRITSGRSLSQNDDFSAAEKPSAERPAESMGNG